MILILLACGYNDAFGDFVFKSCKFWLEADPLNADLNYDVRYDDNNENSNDNDDKDTISALDSFAIRAAWHSSAATDVPTNTRLVSPDDDGDDDGDGGDGGDNDGDDSDGNDNDYLTGRGGHNQ